jgi:hypothetical protein
MLERGGGASWGHMSNTSEETPLLNVIQRSAVEEGRWAWWSVSAIVVQSFHTPLYHGLQRRLVRTDCSEGGYFRRLGDEYTADRM